MPDINILDDNTINRIAAGEVVERPVNIVKELVENSIDAGSLVISIEIKGGGCDLIRVSDNGCGIDRDNIPKAFMRHATSKIDNADDLMNITSLGFRGEALASVAAVAQIEMMTKTKSSILGNRFVIHGGKTMSFDEAGVPDGTTVIVRNLFYNTPARRKFLKSATTEGNLITELVEKLILSHPDITFRYTAGGVTRLSGSGGGDIRSDIYTLFGRDVLTNLTKIEYEGEDAYPVIKGFAGKPVIARGNKNCEIFFVNKRYVKSPVLSRACEEAYKPYLMLHRFPFVILYIDINPEDIDVNVHPSKTEIRFKDEAGVYSMVKDAVEAAVTRHELIPQITGTLPEKKKDAGNTSDVKEDAVVSYETAKTAEAAAEDDAQEGAVPVTDEEKEIHSSRREAPEPFDGVNMALFREAVKEKHDKELKQLEDMQQTLFGQGLLDPANTKDHRIIGQVFDTYWIIEFEKKMYIIDQHAAHEKVLYERIKSRVDGEGVISQLISPPYIVSLTASQEEVVKTNLKEFEDMGFTISHFGGREYALSSVPSDLFGMGEQEYFLCIVDDLAQSGRVRRPEEVKDRIATMACKAAVKGNMKMSISEAHALIDELLSLENPYNCPHGRPTIISFTRSEIEKMFKRIV